MRPTGLGHGVYKDVPDYSNSCGERCVSGRIYETRSGPARQMVLSGGCRFCSGLYGVQ